MTESRRSTLINTFAGLLACATITWAAETAYAGGSGGGFVPVHGSPKMGAGVLVSHDNIKFTAPTNVVRDHRSGYRFDWNCRHDPGACWPGGVSGGTPAPITTGGIPSGATVRDHRH